MGGDDIQLSQKGQKIWNIKQESGPQTRSIPSPLLFTILVGGRFQFSDHNTEYVGGQMYIKEGFGLVGVNVIALRGIVMVAQQKVGLVVHENFSMWHRVAGGNLTNGRKKIVKDDDLQAFYQSKDANDRLVLYVIDEPILQRSVQQFRSKQQCYRPPNSQPIPQVQRVVWYNSNSKQSLAQSQPAPISLRPPIHCPNTSSNPVRPHTLSGPTITKKSDFHSMQPICSSQPQPHNITTHITHATTLRKSTRLPEVIFLGHSPTDELNPNLNQHCHHSTSPVRPPPTQSPVEKRSTPRVKQVARRKKHTQSSTKVAEEKGKSKKAAKKVLFTELSDFSSEGESGSDISDYEYFPVEEDRRQDVDDELWFDSKGSKKGLLSQLQEEFLDLSHTAAKSRGQASTSKGSQPRWEEDNICVENIVELDCDSDEERSLHGSDDEEDQFPIFNPEVDLKGEVKLSIGLIFKSIYDIRKAVRNHSIQKKYSYYFLHNGTGRYEVYCRYKCDCPWNPKKQKIMSCICKKEELKCHFKIKVVQVPMSEQCQIRDMHLSHNCGFFHHSNKITSEWLAEKYISEWKDNPEWKLRAFAEKVNRDTGCKIKYSMAWQTRCRVKQMLYGDARDQYAKVYQYARALLKYNPGSTALVGVTNTEISDVPFFQRFYVCLEACKSGYKRGCRPIIGVDGCHLKGPYPGMILSAIGKDGNNNIFPIAWAIVEVENTSTWTWFLELLMNDTEHIDGQGLTLMSDRQKGLLDAIASVAPKAAVRFCVRHIWANFKLKFSGTIFKDIFWQAAKTTTKQDFEIAMGQIRFLSEDAHEYLASIDPSHWSRHAFTAASKSNMVTNNMCETWNSVIKDARDKPVITCLEWIRRYVMKRHAEKWDGVQSYTAKFMPYIGRVLGYLLENAKECNAVHAREDEWEVDSSDDRVIVNLREKTCSCNHFMLTSIPCKHAICCIMNKRGRPEEYVHEYYSRAYYLAAYSSHIKPMPGYKHWEPCPTVEPLPPLVKNMPGRPKSKKRKKEAGEVEVGRAKKLKKLSSAKKCSNCGDRGHKKVHCSNMVVPATAPKQVKKGGRPPSTNPFVLATKKAKEEKANKMKYVAPSQATKEATNTASSSAKSKEKKASKKKKKEKSLSQDFSLS